jgi:hypothetical protein
MRRNNFSIRIVILILLACFITNIVMAQKVSPDTLTADQLNLYRHKAVKMRNAGIILASCGVGIMATGYIIGVNYEPTGTQDWTAVAIVGISGMAGIATAVAGIPLWAIGGNRKANAEFYLLDTDEYKDLAVRTRNTGRILTFSGTAVAITGIVLYASAVDEHSSAIGVITAMAGIATTIAGIPIWVAGGNRMVKADLTLQTFNIVPENSMAIGLGITLSF